jgi:hypothetical protein
MESGENWTVKSKYKSRITAAAKMQNVHEGITELMKKY